MENGMCPEESRTRETEWAGKSPKEHTLVMSMCMVATWQGVRTLASWNRRMKEGKRMGMGACTSGQVHEDSSA